MKKLVITPLLAAAVLLSGCQTPAEPSPASGIQTLEAAPYAAEIVPAPATLEVKPDRFTTVQYPCSTDNLRIDGTDPWLCDFRYNAACGFGADDTYCDAEMYYGLKGEISSRALSYWFYDYSLSGVTVKSAELVNDVSTRSAAVKSRKVTIDTSELEPGLYYLRAELSNGKQAQLAFYTADGLTMFCTTSENSEQVRTHAERRVKLYELIDLFEVTPGNSYETMRLTYPVFPYSEEYRCDTDLWIKLSSELTRPDWSDGRKLLTMYEWLTDNIVYDSYMADILNERRERANADWSGTYSMYDTHVGVCWDFANVLITMCRAQKIPAISIENTDASHMWAAVFIDGEWFELDPTTDIGWRTVDGEDMSLITEGEKTGSYLGYLSLMPNTYLSQSMLTLNQMLWTAEKDSGGHELRRPKLDYTVDTSGKLVMIL